MIMDVPTENKTSDIWYETAILVDPFDRARALQPRADVCLRQPKTKDEVEDL